MLVSKLNGQPSIDVVGLLPAGDYSSRTEHTSERAHGAFAAPL